MTVTQEICLVPLVVLSRPQANRFNKKGILVVSAEDGADYARRRQQLQKEEGNLFKPGIC